MSRTKQLRKKLDNFGKRVNEKGLIREEFNEQIELMERDIATASEEENPITATCNECEYEIGIRKTPTDTCPVCGAVVVACNECKMDKPCWNCEKGSNFELWNSLNFYTLEYTIKGKKKTEQIKAHSSDEAICILTDRDETKWNDINGTVKRTSK